MTGANGVVGPHLCQRLGEEGLNIATLGRTRTAHSSIIADLAQPSALAVNGRFDILVHMAPLWLLPDNLENIGASGVHRLIAFSSTSAETKMHSGQMPEQELARRLSVAEQRISESAGKLGIRSTVLRPTMIYGFGRDSNIMVIAALVRRFGFFPIAGSGQGLRQPVHTLDLVESVVRCMRSGATDGKTYNLGGAEQLTYKAMVHRIFHALGRTPRTLHVPVPLYSALIKIGLKLKIITGLSPGAAARMGEDLCFDTGPAQRDFGYRPCAFLQNSVRDLPA